MVVEELTQEEKNKVLFQNVDDLIIDCEILHKKLRPKIVFTEELNLYGFDEKK